MNTVRIIALVKRNLALSYRGLDPLVDTFYWPLFDLLLWGFTTRGLSSAKNPQLAYVWIIGLILWQGCVRSNLDISFNFLREIWSKNVVNLFASPLRLSEWIVAALLLGCINAFVVVAFGSIVAYLLYGVNVFAVGKLVVILFMLLLQSGWIIGCFTTGCIMMGGIKVQKLVWVLGWFFAPFSALFYTLDALPRWAYAIAKFVPMSYAFEGLRSYTATGVIPWSYLLTALSLNCLYLGLALYFLVRMFFASKAKGLARLESE